MPNNRGNVLYIVVPCYNEEDVLLQTSVTLKSKLDLLQKEGRISPNSKIMFVDDGSTDNTWNIIEKLHSENSLFSGVKLSRNKGHQVALFAGLTQASKYADAIISVDADMQDDIDAIDIMLEEYYNGAEIVYGVRSKRKKDSFFKRFTAESFYKLMNKMGVNTVFNHADYRLMSKRATDCLMEYSENNLFLRGIIPQIGYKTATVEYERKERLAGESKYPLKKMIGLAVDGITSFSIKPLSIIFIVGIISAVIGFAAFAATLILYLVGLIDSLYSILSFILFQSGIILTAIGIVGAYVGKAYIETKKRPRYFVDKIL